MRLLFFVLLATSCLAIVGQVTFNVDMVCAQEEFTDVYVTGPWCGWCANDIYNTMTDPDGDGVYTVVIEELTGTVEYKYAVDAWASQENLVNDMQDGADCAPVTDYNGYANRTVMAGPNAVTNDFYGTCDGTCNDGPYIIEGCTDSAACNYDASATLDDGSCAQLDECGICGGSGIPLEFCDCQGNQPDALGVCGGTCLEDDDNNGICDNSEVYGCTYAAASNYNTDATRDDGSCLIPCVQEGCGFDYDGTGDGSVGTPDLLGLLSEFGLTGTDADGDGICDAIDDCVGEYDECGECNGPGPTVPVIESIEILYDSLYAEQIDQWWVFEVGADTTFSYTCLPLEPVFQACGDPVSYQGYDYATVLIGEQCWFTENLRCENYDNGDAIPAGLSNSDWTSTTCGATAVYGEEGGTCETDTPDGDACDEAWSLNEYGRLYNWYAVDDSRGLCPSGWHVPTNEEWLVMMDFLGGWATGGLMKTTYGWAGGSNGTNSSGFSGLPGGYRVSYGFGFAGIRGAWWSSSLNAPSAYSLQLTSSEYQNNVLGPPYDGLSIRCVQD